MTRPDALVAHEAADVVAARAAMVDDLVARGVARDPRIEAALRAVPRDVFLPEVLTDPNGLRGPVLTDNPSDRAAWLAAVYANKTSFIEAHRQAPRTSGTMPGLIATMIDALDLTGDDSAGQVLQVGTGTGYTAALLCHIAGDERVASIDLEADLVARAQDRLARLGFHPALDGRDGLHGWETRAPLDRVLATCGVDRIPRAWLAQLRDGGTLVAPLRGAVAVVNRTGAEGRGDGFFWGQAAYFMPLRPVPDESQNAAGGDHAVAPAGLDGTSRRRETPHGPWETYYHNDVRFLLDLSLPDLRIGQHGPGLDNLSVFDRRGNEARLHIDDNRTVTVEERGERPLWQQVEQTTKLWHHYNQPGRDRFGISIRGDEQTVWLDSPLGPSWRLPG